MMDIVFWYGFVSGLLFTVALEYFVIWYALTHIKRGVS